MSVHEAKCSFKPVRCEWCKETVSDEKVCYYTAIRMLFCDLVIFYSCIWRMIVRCFLGSASMAVVKKLPRKM